MPTKVEKIKENCPLYMGDSHDWNLSYSGHVDAFQTPQYNKTQ